MDRLYVDILKNFLLDENIERLEFIAKQDGISTGNFKIKGKETAIAKEIMRRFRIQNKKLLEQVSILKEQLKIASGNQKKILEDLKQLIKINKELAAALGSCNECWGEDSECLQCGGLGIPGWKASNKKHFTYYVAPILTKLPKTKQSRLV